MTTLTKIFVILVCLFAFIFTPMAIQFAARTYDWRDLAIKYRDAAESAQAAAQSAKNVAVSTEINYQAQLQEKEKALLDAQRRNEELLVKITSLTQERDQLARSRDSLETSTTLLSGQMEVVQSQNQKLLDQKKDLVGSELELREKNISLSEMIKKLNADLVVLGQQLREQKEIAHQFRSENEQLRRQMKVGRAAEPFATTPTPTAQGTDIPSAAPINATVTAVKGNMASIDAGKASGVKPGLRLVVLRGDERNPEYVCDLEITEATPTEAVGKIMLEGDKRIRPGDRVQDDYSFSTGR